MICAPLEDPETVPVLDAPLLVPPDVPLLLEETPVGLVPIDPVALPELLAPQAQPPKARRTTATRRIFRRRFM